MRWGSYLLLFVIAPSSAVTVKTRPCTGGTEAARIRMEVRRPDGGDLRSLARIKRIEKGSRILYKGIDMPQDLKNNARVTLAVSPAEEGANASLTLLEFKPAAIATEWVIPFRTSMVVFVMGPQGLDEKRVTTMVTRDQDLLAALADYADQTEEIEATVALLSEMDEDEEQDGDAVLRLNRADPGDRAAFAVLRAMNTSMMAANPMGAGKRQGPVTMMNKATVGFFENAGALFPGGGALNEIKPFFFPDTDFRAAFVQPSGESLSLCVPRTMARTRNRQVYLWARRILDVPAPTVLLASKLRAAIGTKAPVGLRIEKPSQWAHVEQVDRWTLTPVSGGEALAVRATVYPADRALDLDLRGFPGKPGRYLLRGDWDWQQVNVRGELELAALGDLRQARVAGPPQGLIEGRGPALLPLEGTDFEFVERVTLRPEGADAEFGRSLPFLLRQGRRGGLQDRMDVEVDTRLLRAGGYLLALAQADGRARELPVRVQPDDVRIDNLPLRVASGAGTHRLLLRGAGLERLTGATVEGGTVTLEPVLRPGERWMSVEMKSAAQGGKLELAFAVNGSDDRRRFPEAIAVLGPRPKLQGVRTSVPEDLGVTLRQGEIPAGAFSSFALQMDAGVSAAALVITCGDRTLRLGLGERSAQGSLTQPGDGTLFLSLDPASLLRPQCSLTAALETSEGLLSEPAALGRPVRVPRVDSIEVTGEKLTDGNYAATLTGQGLELIEQTGWSTGNGAKVTALPSPVAGPPMRQTLRIGMPWPSPAPRSPVVIWLRGESEGRTTTARY